MFSDRTFGLPVLMLFPKIGRPMRVGENIVEEEVQLSDDADAGAALPIDRNHRFDAIWYVLPT